MSKPDAREWNTILSEFFAGKRNLLGDYWHIGLAKEAHESLLAEAEKSERKAVQQLKETNRQLSCGVSIGGRQFYGTPDDVAWLTDSMKARDALQSRLDAVVGLAEKWEEFDRRKGSPAVHSAAAQLRAALGGESHGNEEELK